MACSKKGMRDFQECDKFIVNANGVTLPIIYGTRRMLLKTHNSDWIEVILTEVAYAPSKNYHLLSFNSVTDKGQESVGRRDGLTVYWQVAVKFVFRYMNGYPNHPKHQMTSTYFTARRVTPVRNAYVRPPRAAT